MKKLALGIDIGGTNTAFGLVDESGDMFGTTNVGNKTVQTSSESVISTRAYPSFKDYKHYVEDLCEAIRKLLKSIDFEYELVGIGVGAPNANIYRGTIEHPANMWKFSDDEEDKNEDRRVFHFAEDLSTRLNNVPVYVTNDANAATIGEMVYGNAKGMKDFIQITLGTGLGSGFVANGKLIYGHDGNAGEFGHVTVERGGRDCGCGCKGCLEAYCSATGIKRTAFELMATMSCPSPLRQVPYDALDAAMLSQAADNNDPIALEAFRLTGQKLGYALADAVTISSPEAIFIFGGLAKAGEKLFKHVRYYMEEEMCPVFKNKVKVLPSGLQNKNAAILGASALVWQTLNNTEE